MICMTKMQSRLKPVTEQLVPLSTIQVKYTTLRKTKEQLMRLQNAETSNRYKMNIKRIADSSDNNTHVQNKVMKSN